MVYLGRTKRVHFVGIGGIGMSGIAEVLLNLGFQVTGSDIRASENTARLEALGATIFLTHDADNVEGCDVVVYSSAVNHTNPEVAAADEQGIPAVPRGVMLAELMRLKFAITVAGSHGKTSTTSLCASVLAQGGLDPTVIVGGKLRAISTNARLGGSRYVVAEADESDGQFVQLPSSIAIITNIDLEHLDFYPGLEALKESFVTYASRVPFYGSVILCADDENVRDVAPRIHRRKIMYSLGGEGDLVGKVESRDERGTRFTVDHGGKRLGTILLGIPGDHYVSNALAAIAVGLEMEISFDDIREGLETFEGVGRRFEVKGVTANGVTVVDDYGHHPTEIAATVKAANANYGARLFVLFQPHRYSRTQSVADAFANCFDGAHKVYITDIYPAGEKPIPGVTSQLIIDRIKGAGGPEVVHAPNVDQMVEAVCTEIGPGDMLMTMGAGDIYRAGEAVLDRLGRKEE